MTLLLTPLIFPSTQESNGTELSVSQELPRESFALECYPSELCLCAWQGTAVTKVPKAKPCTKGHFWSSTKRFYPFKQWPVCARSGLWVCLKGDQRCSPHPLQCCLCSSGPNLTVEWDLKQKFFCSSCAQLTLSEFPVPGPWASLAFIPLLISSIQDLPSRTSLLVSLLSKTTCHFGNIPFSSPALLSRAPRPQFSLCSLCTKAQQVPPNQ